VSDWFDSTPPVILTNRLRLRALALGDAPAVYSFASDPAVARYTLWSVHLSEADSVAFIHGLVGPARLTWAISLIDLDRAMGMVFLHSLNRHHRRAEIAFNLDRRNWGRGYVSEAASAVADFAFHTLGLNRIVATCMPANVAAKRVLAKLGMVREGQMRRSHLRYDGAHDMELHGLLASDRARAIDGSHRVVRHAVGEASAAPPSH